MSEINEDLKNDIAKLCNMIRNSAVEGRKPDMNKVISIAGKYNVPVNEDGFFGGEYIGE